MTSRGGEDEYDDDNSDVAWLWGIIIGLYLLGTVIWNFGWQIVAAIAAALVVTSLLVWLGVALVRIYLASELHRIRKYRKMLRYEFRSLIRQAKRLRPKTKTRPTGR